MFQGLHISVKALSTDVYVLGIFSVADLDFKQKHIKMLTLNQSEGVNMKILAIGGSVNN